MDLPALLGEFTSLGQQRGPQSAADPAPALGGRGGVQRIAGLLVREPGRGLVVRGVGEAVELGLLDTGHGHGVPPQSAPGPAAASWTGRAGASLRAKASSGAGPGGAGGSSVVSGRSGGGAAPARTAEDSVTTAADTASTQPMTPKAERVPRVASRRPPASGPNGWTIEDRKSGGALDPPDPVLRGDDQQGREEADTGDRGQAHAERAEDSCQHRAADPGQGGGRQDAAPAGGDDEGAGMAVRCDLGGEQRAGESSRPRRR